MWPNGSVPSANLIFSKKYQGLLATVEPNLAAGMSTILMQSSPEAKQLRSDCISALEKLRATKQNNRAWQGGRIRIKMGHMNHSSFTEETSTRKER